MLAVARSCRPYRASASCVQGACAAGVGRGTGREGALWRTAGALCAAPRREGVAEVRVSSSTSGHAGLRPGRSNDANPAPAPTVPSQLARRLHEVFHEVCTWSPLARAAYSQPQERPPQSLQTQVDARQCGARSPGKARFEARMLGRQGLPGVPGCLCGHRETRQVWRPS